MKEFHHPAMKDVPIEAVFRALGDPVRLDIVRRLARGGETTCGALDCGRPKSTMSHHFRVLREAGLVRTRSEGTTHYNMLRKDELIRRFGPFVNVMLDAVAIESSGQQA